MNRNVLFSNITSNIYIYKSFLNASKGRFGKSFQHFFNYFQYFSNENIIDISSKHNQIKNRYI